MKESSLPCGLILAPMAGFTDSAMRRVCYECGADAAVTEMVSAKAVVYHDKKTAALARIHPEEKNTSLQLFGSEPEILAQAAAALSEGAAGGLTPSAIDVNMGCPVPKVFSNGEGSALMRTPEKIETIVRAMRAACPLPITVKIRAGVDPDHKNAVECALAAEAGGAAAVTVHGRTRSQLYSGRADRALIARVKEAVHIPLIANGDITSGAEALDMIAQTHPDGLMIGRGAVGDPFLFAEIRAALAGVPYCPPTPEEKVRMALRQLSLAIEEKGERNAVRECRKMIGSYVSGMRGAVSVRVRVYAAETYGEVSAALTSILDPD